MIDTYVEDPATKRQIIGRATGSVLDYSIDWTEWMAPGDTIVSGVVTAAAGITVVSSGFVSVLASAGIVASHVLSAFISGGVAGQTYRALFQIVTIQGRTDNRAIYLRTKERP